MATYEISKSAYDGNTYNFKDAKSRAALAEIVDRGPKNIADMSLSSFTTASKDGVTVTLSGDTITTSNNSGTTTNSFYNVFYTASKVMIPPGDWVAVLNGTGIESFRIEEYDNITGDVVRGEFGEPLSFTVPSGVTTSYVRITQKPSSNCAGTFKLMICSKADWDISQTFKTYDDHEDKQGAALVELVDSGLKNIADGRRSSVSTGGVAFTFEDDGTFLADATATNKKSTSAIMLQVCAFTPKAGETYVLSGCPSGGTTTSYALRVTTSADTSLAWDTGSGAIFTASSSDPLIIKCSIKSGIVINNMTFRPMICTKAAWDISNAYKAYDDHDDALAELIDSGPKNMLEMTQTQASITRTSGNSSMTAVYDKAAGTVTLTGTHYSADSALIFEFYSGSGSDTRPLPAGTYHLSGCYPGGSTSTWRAALTSISGAVDIGDGAFFTLSESMYCAYRILVSGNCTLDGAVFYPMVCPKSLWGVSKAFKPYLPSYQDLYSMVKAIQNAT